MKKKNNENLKASPTVTFGIVNPALSVEPTTVYSTVTSSLNVTLTNKTDKEIAVANKATLTVYMPGYFTPAEVKAMKIATVSMIGWTFSYNAADNFLLLTYSGERKSINVDTALTFTIENIICAKTSGSDTVQLNLDGFSGSDIPLQIMAPLMLSIQPVPAQLNLPEVLMASTDHGGEIYVSTAVDPLTNSIYLNLKNTGSTPLYNGAEKWTGNPTVRVTFVYGSTSGALAPADKQNPMQKGSAWAISGAVSVDQTGGWSVTNPSPSGGANSPSWVLAPLSKQIIGINDQANVTFVFNNVLSFTPSGPTQMYVHFSGFRKNERDTYNDHTFVVPILKTNAPSNRGIVKITGPAKLFIKSPQDVSVRLDWTGFRIASIDLDCDATPAPAMLPYDVDYPNPAPLVFDSKTVVLPLVTPGTRVLFTFTSYDGNKQTLNMPQFGVTIDQKPGIYLFAGPAADVACTMNKAVNLIVNWKVYRATSVKVFQGTNKLAEKTYSDTSLWETDSATISATSSALHDTQTFTLEAYDKKGLIERTQCTVKFAATAWCDPHDQKIYPLVKVNNQIWLGKNYDREIPGKSSWYYNDQKYEAQYGSTYVYDAIKQNVPEGWRLPTIIDWYWFYLTYGAQPYTAMMPGGESGLNLELGGAVYTDVFRGLEDFGIYWSASMPDQFGFVMLSSQGKAVWPADFPLDSTFFMITRASVRFIYKEPGEGATPLQIEIPKFDEDEGLLRLLMAPKEE